MKGIKTLVCLFMCFYVLVSVCVAQKAESSTVYVVSWANDHLRDQKFNVELDSARNQYTKEVFRWGGVGYKLIFTKIPAGKEDYQLEYWRVELKEILSAANTKREKLGCNLFTENGCGRGGDSFSRVDWVGDLFPRENPSKIDLLLRGQYYPIKATRVIKVKSFFVIISVNGYEMSRTNRKKLDSMNVTVEFKNFYQFEEKNN
jgi:hypothetical protein